MVASNNLAINRIVMLTMLCYPVLLLTVRGSMNAFFFLLLLLSLFYLFRAGKAWSRDQWDAGTVAFGIALASPVVAMLLSQAYHRSFSAPPFDAPSRFLLAVPIYLALRQMRIGTLAVVQYGLPVGAMLAAVISVFFARPYVFDPARVTNSFLHPIHFGNLSLMLGFLSVLSINWTRRDALYVVILKWAGLAAGLFASVHSGTRGGWVAIPIMVLAWYFFQNRTRRVVRLLAPLALIVLAVVASYFLVGSIHDRLYQIYSDIAAFRHGEGDTSIGMRLQLWTAALHLFAENPIFGVGPYGYAPALPALQQAGLISPLAVSIGAGEIDNYILANTVTLGIFGLLSGFAIFLVPLLILVKAAASEAGPQKKSAVMGVCLVLGFFVFGLTADTFDIKMVAAFYGLTLAILLAGATSRAPA